jgi:hypothetical protein
MIPDQASLLNAAEGLIELRITINLPLPIHLLHEVSLIDEADDFLFV